MGEELRLVDMELHWMYREVLENKFLKESGHKSSDDYEHEFIDWLIKKIIILEKRLDKAGKS